MFLQKEKKKIRNKIYKEKNKDKVKHGKKEYKEIHKDKVNHDKKKYKEKHKEEVKQDKKKYREKHKGKIKQDNKEYYENNSEKRLPAMRELMAEKREEERRGNESTRVNFTNTDSRHVIAMEPGGRNVQRHFKRHQDCPEANTFLNHITTYRNHFTGNPSDPNQHEELREQIRSQLSQPKSKKN